MDWPEIEKAIWTYFDGSWNTSVAEAVYPGQEKNPTGNKWIELHILSQQEIPHRRSNKKQGEILFQIGIFSKEENIYSAADVHKELQNFISQKDLDSGSFIVRFEEPQSVNVPFKEDNNIEKHIWHRPITIMAKVWEK